MGRIGSDLGLGGQRVFTHSGGRLIAGQPHARRVRSMAGGRGGLELHRGREGTTIVGHHSVPEPTHLATDSAVTPVSYTHLTLPTS